jgi:hypothetical protein
LFSRHRIRLLLNIEGLPVSTPSAKPGELHIKQGEEEDDSGAKKLVADLDLEAVRKEKAKWLGTEPGFCEVMEKEGLDQIAGWLFACFASAFHSVGLTERSV